MGTEYTLVEKPIIEYLRTLGYEYILPEGAIEARDGLNNVIIKDVLIDSLIRLNDVPQATATAVYQELLTVSDNERWTHLLRGESSKSVPGFKTKKTIKLIDFKNTGNNTFSLTNQFEVIAERKRIPDIVVFVNGIPLVVIEAKSPVSYKDKSGEAFAQIKQYEEQIPRLFYSNLFNLITQGHTVLYGATGADSQYWGVWRDPWPKTDSDFASEFEKGLWCLLEPSRLLDLLAHFVVFEKRDNKVIKKVCRYQQFRAVNKIVNRVIEDRPPEDRRGLIWASTGSGKSLTMVMTALKLKTHRNVDSAILTSPNILVVTDRVNLDTQISGTFAACGLPNPVPVQSSNDLKDMIHTRTTGQTLLSTIFKFSGSRKPVKNSGNWIIMVDESHRTQEADLGAYLHTTFPEAWFFGFTGTPIKKTDKNTYRNFSPRGEQYLDRYSIDDAVADGATVPIFYTSRKTEWQINNAELDILFDQWFSDLSEERRAEIKRKELNVATILKHPRRVELITRDIWEHYKNSAMKDGYKAQVVCVDRTAIILYKRAFNTLIEQELVADGIAHDEAVHMAEGYTVPVYSESQEDEKPAEDPYIDSIRKDLVRYRLNDDKGYRFGSKKRRTPNPTENEVIAAFNKKGEPPYILIVCSKLLTGFDAPVESVMYLDNPLSEHNLLQAIARTNRVADEHKPHGLIVDYVGITKNLTEALSSYRKEDVGTAMIDLNDLRSELRQAHHNIMEYIRGLKRDAEADKKGLQSEFNELFKKLDSLDNWLDLKRKAQSFIKLYSALSPDPAVLDYTRDIKWISLMLPVGTLHFEKSEAPDLKGYSGKIRDMLAQELEVTGLSTVVKVRSLNDPAYWDDFRIQGKSEEELETVAVRKVAELKKSISEKRAENDAQYAKFSEKLKEIIQKIEERQMDFAQIIKEQELLTKAIEEEGRAYESTGLTKTAHGVWKLLEAFKPEPEEGADNGDGYGSSGQEGDLQKLQKVALEIEELYTSNDSAPKGWELKEQLRKELRQQVRQLIFPLRLNDWKAIPLKVEEFALKNYVRV